MIIILTLLSVLFSGALGANVAILKRIQGNLKCVCPCPHLLGQCGDECGMAPQMNANIQKKLNSGMTEKEIYADYEKEFGLSIHAAPKTEGFYLLAWIIPFFVLMSGGVIVVLFVKSRKPKVNGTKTSIQSRSISSKHRKMLDRELAE